VSSHRFRPRRSGQCGFRVASRRPRARLDSFPDTERQRRFLVGVALAYAQWDKQTKRTGPCSTPNTVHPAKFAPALRGLVADLMQHRNHVAPHGLRDLAIRTYAVA
jgi:hypothetical protein